MARMTVTIDQENAEYVADQAGEEGEFESEREVVNAAVRRMRSTGGEEKNDNGSSPRHEGAVSLTIEELHREVRENDERITNLEDRLGEKEE